MSALVMGGSRTMLEFRQNTNGKGINVPTKNIVSTTLCLIGWIAVIFHVYQGYGLDHLIGFVGFILAGIGHAIKVDVIGFKAN